MLQGLYNKKAAVPSALSSLSVLFVVPCGIYLCKITLYFLLTYQFHILPLHILLQVRLISQILVKSIFSLHNYYDYANTVPCWGKEYTLVTFLWCNLQFLRFTVALFFYLLSFLYTNLKFFSPFLSSEFSILKPTG